MPLGSPIAGRADQALDELVGFFVNTLVLRTDTSGNPGFAELLARVLENALAAYAHQDVPFEYLVELLNPAWSLAHHPLFQVMLALQNAPVGEFALPGLETGFEPAPTDTARVDLTFSLAEEHSAVGGPAGLRGAVEYATDLFDEATVEALFARWVRLLEAAVADPERPIGAVDLLSAEERDLAARDAVTVDLPAVGLPALFEAQARRTPDAIAVVCEDAAVTYRELDARANRLARALTAQGAGPEAPVAVLLERSIDLVTAVLAVVKAGAAYVPLDPRFPSSRIDLMMRETGAGVLLSPDVLTALGETEQDGSALGIGCHPRQLAYIMYTSGSTGQPKGVGVTHHDVTALALDPCWAAGGHERVLLHSPTAFDASTYELWVPLLTGGQVVVAPPGQLDAPTVARTIAQHGVTGMFLAAGLFQLLAEQQPDCFSGAREVWAGGDVVSPVAVARVLAACPGLTVANGYGPTETTTFALSHRPAAPPAGDRPVPLGRPLANMRAHVLDGACGRCRRAWSASSTSPEPASRAATWAGRA
ncbi:non-ribosomal peptide synthetase [Kitasatospora sp. NBC_00039]|uniref:non-ribosomal peptide synthetase n=1 Tax=Kitasatospora sp. NBC_00039 TaxID=2903565 RepID=UPI0038677062